jgi:hypothetical protein
MLQKSNIISLKDYLERPTDYLLRWCLKPKNSLAGQGQLQLANELFEGYKQLAKVYPGFVRVSAGGKWRGARGVVVELCTCVQVERVTSVHTNSNSI